MLMGRRGPTSCEEELKNISNNIQWQHCCENTAYEKKIFKHHLESTIVYEAHLINENIKTTYYVTT